MDFLLEFDGQVSDLVVDGTAFRKHSGLRTAVILSLFLDRRAQDANWAREDPRGSWIDALAEDVQGSRLWEIARRPLVPNATAVEVEDAIREALEWMREDGVASQIDVEVEVVMSDRLNIEVGIHQPEGDVQRFAFVWDAVRGGA